MKVRLHLRHSDDRSPLNLPKLTVDESWKLVSKIELKHKQKRKKKVAAPVSHFQRQIVRTLVYRNQAKSSVVCLFYSMEKGEVHMTICQDIEL